MSFARRLRFFWMYFVAGRTTFNTLSIRHGCLVFNAVILLTLPSLHYLECIGSSEQSTCICRMQRIEKKRSWKYLAGIQFMFSMSVEQWFIDVSTWNLCTVTFELLIPCLADSLFGYTCLFVWCPGLEWVDGGENSGTVVYSLFMHRMIGINWAIFVENLKRDLFLHRNFFSQTTSDCFAAGECLRFESI